MILLYTGAESNNKPQPTPSKSLGGFVSNSPIANGVLGNLFPVITKSMIVNDQKQIRMLVLKNTLAVDVNSVRIWTEVADSSKLQIAAVAPGMDECNNPVFEQVYDDSALPFQAALDYHELEPNAINVGSITAGSVIGIWIRREIDLTKFPGIIPDPENPLTCQGTADLLKSIGNTAKDENIKLIIDWA